MGGGSGDTLSWSRHEATLPLLCSDLRANALSTVPRSGRAMACMFPRRLLDRLHGQRGSGADMEGGSGNRQEMFSLGAAGPALGQPEAPNLLPWPKPVLCPVGRRPGAGVSRQLREGVRGAVSVWRATGPLPG